jgi:hypothetical protein
MIVNAISQLGLSLLAASAKPAGPVNAAMRSRSLHARQMLEPEDELEEPTAAEISAAAEWLAAFEGVDESSRVSPLRTPIMTPADAADAYASN